jgi:hypothetical protein
MKRHPGRPQLAPFDAERQAALTAEIDAAAPTQPSVSRRRLLVREAGQLLAAAERYEAIHLAWGLLGNRNQVTGTFESYLAITARLDRVLRLLGLETGTTAEPPKPSVEELIRQARIAGGSERPR